MTKNQVNRWFASKINTVAAMLLAVNLMAFLGYLPPEIENTLTMLANIGMAGLIVVFRTWFTGPRA